MQTNQRARLVLHPIVLVALLLITGLAVGVGLYLRRGGDATEAGADSSNHPIRLAGLQLSSDHLDFGDMDLEGAVSRQLRLQNGGPAPLVLRLEGTNAFTVDPAKLTVEPGDAARVTVTANPRRAGAIRDELRIYQDGASQPPLVVRLEGNARSGGGPSSAEGPAALGEVPEGGSANPTVNIATLSPEGVRSTAVGGGAAQAQGSVQITRSTGEAASDSAEPTDAGAGSTGQASSSPSVTTVPRIGSSATRSMADRPAVPTGDVGDDETAVPVDRNPKDPDELEPKDPKKPETPGVPAFVVTPSSSLTLMGTSNQFYPQQVGVYGSASGGNFSLAGTLQFPKIPLAFGQSVAFTQNGSAVGTFDPGSGQVTISLALSAIDSNGNAAPVQMVLTTGMVQTRNTSGVLISMTGQSRIPGTGQLRLVGIGKIPPNHRNQAEEQLVMVDLLASLGFGSSGTENASASGGE